MKKITKKDITLVAFLVLAVVIGVSYFTDQTLFNAQNAEAGAGHNVSGWAWSEKIGWISFNNTSDGATGDYGVAVDVSTKAEGGTGSLSGYAWSEYLGWISFDRSVTNNPPSAPFDGGSGPIAQVNWSTGKVTGWARALSGCQETAGVPVVSCSSSSAGGASGGWDGWIKLSDDSIPAWANRGIRISGNKFVGHAWGSDVVGWVDFAPAVRGIPIGVQIAQSSCTPADVGASGEWGSCTPTNQCTSAGTFTDAPGIQIGVCSGGGTVVRSCLTTQVCTETSTSGTEVWQF